MFIYDLHTDAGVPEVEADRAQVSPSLCLRPLVQEAIKFVCQCQLAGTDTAH